MAELNNDETIKNKESKQITLLNDVKILFHVKSIFSMICDQIANLTISGNKLLTTLGVKSSSPSYLDDVQLKLLSESEPDFLQSFLINSDIFYGTLNKCTDIHALILMMNIFSRIKILPLNQTTADVISLICNSKYFENLNNALVKYHIIQDVVSLIQLQEFLNNCIDLNQYIINPESKNLLNDIVLITFTKLNNKNVKLNIDSQYETEIIPQVNLDEIKITNKVQYGESKWPLCYKTLSIYPIPADLVPKKVFLNPNIMKGRYDSVEHYLDVQFRLLREDFIAPMREGIQCYKSMKEKGMEIINIPNMHTYYESKIVKQIVKDEKILLFINFYTKENFLKDSKRFMSESLLVFSNDHFQTMFFAIVVRMNHKNIYPTKSLICKPLGKPTLIKLNSVYTMAECDTYFLPYKYTMDVLQKFNEYSFPMRSYIIDAKTNPRVPAYLIPHSKYFKIDGKIFDILDDYQWPDNQSLGLDYAQCLAFKAALTKEFTVIQGPPGTGKTFIGVRIVKSIIENMYRTNILKNPIIVVCYTNHALDQFLEGLLSITNKIVRIGGGSKSDLLKTNSLKNHQTSSIEFLKKSFVIGLTTTGAAMKHSILLKLKSPIVIVEEAAEVLESHVVISLTEHCQHVILIGDHKQLRPRTATFTLAKQFHFDISLFERLVKNDYPCYTLQTQHRMRPEISSLILPIYPYLRNHNSVNNRDNICGVTKNMYFINHENSEEKVLGSASYKNMHEIYFLMEFTRYLLNQGYQQGQITILVTYKEQLLELQKIRESSYNLEYFRIECVDGYQGEENDIILLSLVRNNETNKIGFLSILNRVCVALSRARNGLYIMGNMENLLHSFIWKRISNILVCQDSIGNKLTLRCPVHKDWIKTVCKSTDFADIQCLEICNVVMYCGHQCKEYCHIRDQCHENIYRCKKEYTKVLPCGLEIKIECWMRNLFFMCPPKVVKKVNFQTKSYMNYH